MVVEPTPFHGMTTGRATDGHEESDMSQVAPLFPNALNRLTLAWSMRGADADVEVNIGASPLKGESV